MPSVESRVPSPNVFETANAGFAQAVYEEYLKDPAAVAPEWRRLFDAGQVGERPPVTAPTNGAKAISGTGAQNEIGRAHV